MNYFKLVIPSTVCRVKYSQKIRIVKKIENYFNIKIRVFSNRFFPG
jgi:hypothetical protein